MAANPKHKNCRSQETVKRTSAAPFVENPIGQKFTVVYIVHGIKHVRCGCISRSFSGGDTVCMAVGTFEIENIPDVAGIYEEIAVSYSAAELQTIITRLHLIYDISIGCSTNVKGLKRCCGYRAESATASVFLEIGRSIDAGAEDDSLASRKSDLIYSLMTHAGDDMTNCILDNMDPELDAFIRTMFEHIFVPCTVKMLAAKCNRSVSAFKSEFWNLFGTSPHHWLTEQRMKRACFLLRTTDRSIESIGIECIHSNSSHFIKVFRKSYDTTPAEYRRRIRVPVMAEKE